jgi:hypothetical protein
MRAAVEWELASGRNGGSMMSRRNTRFVLLLTGFTLIGGNQPGIADSQRPRPAATDFDQIIDRIRSAVADRAWQTPGWKDDVIESVLKKVVATAKTSANRDALSLPVAFNGLRPVRPDRPFNFLGTNLLVANGIVDVDHAKKSIILVDGSIRIGHAHDCIVIARGFADVTNCDRCVVIAGHHVNIGFDLGDDMPSKPSLIASGRSMRIAHADSTICSAPEFIHVSHAKNMDFLASPNRDISHQEACRFKDKVLPPLTMPLPTGVPSTLFTVKQVCDAESNPARQLVTVEKNGIEYVLRLGSKIADEKGQPIPSWSDWSVSFISEGVVLFSDGKSDMSARERFPGQ